MNNARFYGDGPYKVAVLHGGPGALGSVAALARALSDKVGVIEPLQTKLSIAALLEELDEVLHNASDEPVVLIGHSWGAWLGWLYAARHPERVRKLVLVGSGVFEAHYVPEIARNRAARLSETERAAYFTLFERLADDSVADKDALMKQLGGLVAKSDNYDTFDIETDRADCLPVRAEHYNSIWPEAARMRADGELLACAAAIACPVVAIHGESDPSPAEGVRVPLASRLKDFSFHLLEKCGHSPWKEKHASQNFLSILAAETG